MKTYFRLLSFAKPIGKFALPYMLFALLSVLFGTLNLALVGPLLNTLFTKEEAELMTRPEGGINVVDWFNYYAQQFSIQYGEYGALQIVCVVIVASVFLSNLFRYLSQR